jgi:hypothetical protein
MRMPGFNAEASLYRLDDSRYMTIESAAQADRKSIVPQLFSHSRGWCIYCDEYGNCDIIPCPPGRTGWGAGGPTTGSKWGQLPS